MNYSLVFCLQARQGQTTVIIAHWLSSLRLQMQQWALWMAQWLNGNTHRADGEKGDRLFTYNLTGTFIIIAIIICIIIACRMIYHRPSPH